MNPPDYYPVPDEVLEVAERACKKYLASSETIPEVVEIVTDLLIGGDWPDCHTSFYSLRNQSFFYDAMYYLLPTKGEKDLRTQVLRHSNHINAFDYFKKHLNETS